MKRDILIKSVKGMSKGLHLSERTVHCSYQLINEMYKNNKLPERIYENAGAGEASNNSILLFIGMLP